MMVAIRGLFLVALVAGLTSGCVAAGLATGPLMSAIQLVGDRTVERTVAAELAEAVAVTEAALVRMAFKVEERERDDDLRRLRAVADGVTVHAKLQRVTARMTRVVLRVEAGGILADRDTGTQIHEQIAGLLAPAARQSGPAPSDGASAEALNSLQTEIRKLRSDLDERRAADRQPLATDAVIPVSVQPGAIVNVPMSAALPTVGGPAPPVSVPTPTAAIPAVVAESGSERREMVRPALDTRVTAPLHRAGALIPIQPATSVGSSK
jgi:hypothetical protein